MCAWRKRFFFLRGNKSQNKSFFYLIRQETIRKKKIKNLKKMRYFYSLLGQIYVAGALLLYPRKGDGGEKQGFLKREGRERESYEKEGEMGKKKKKRKDKPKSAKKFSSLGHPENDRPDNFYFFVFFCFLFFVFFLFFCFVVLFSIFCLHGLSPPPPSILPQLPPSNE